MPTVSLYSTLQQCSVRVDHLLWSGFHVEVFHGTLFVTKETLIHPLKQTPASSNEGPGPELAEPPRNLSEIQPQTQP